MNNRPHASRPNLARTLLWIGLLSAGATLAQTPSARPEQAYPNKPVRVITSEPGGGTDVVARMVAQGISATLGQNVIVDNRVFALSGELVSKATPDGYTLLAAGTPLWTAPLLQKMNYDLVRDFAPISLMTRAPSVLVVHPAVAAKSVKELIALAKARPGELNYGSGLAGTANHLAGELFKSMAGVNIVRIPFKGTGPTITALLGGQVQMMFGNAGATAPHIAAGRLRSLAVASAQPSALFPGLPTVAATLPGYESVSVNTFFAPARTPAAIVSMLHREVARFLVRPDTREKLLATGVESVASTPEELRAAMKSEMARLAKVIKAAGIREGQE